ncbi:MAG TPA: DNA-processing protein DprA [Aequorivita sp.]|jgi:DNA processing protein|nr:DNA-protecting protein DprA [Aequorivita sp.]MBP40897.1 DNA-protecting protein DprA [Aequorivita sp.]HBC03707.1 DNA-protecting protein DprA [Aequorivita sp.]HNP67819.1 DNA-processing protein DprA [Aequorivita sp.]|tara:strand:- start:122 stop:1225 length:1104 start_codon:yes stop_codon:yes gene_type:complete
MLSKDELRYTLALQRIPNLGDISAKKLLRKMSSAEAVFKEKKSNLAKIDGIGLLRLKDINLGKQLEEADAELNFIEENNIEYSYFKDKTYPEKLKHCLDGPILFFHRGNIDLVGKKIISIVGTRKITSYGNAFCESLIEEIAPLNPVIVSGLAYGVDICAHKAAIDNNLQNIACLAHGLNQIYPKSHKKYIQKIEENGGFITEFWSSDVFDRNNFLKRNRIIAGLSEATIVIESAEKGGSLVTADIANSYNREVFAVPGRATDSQSRGCNNLIKQQKAQLLTSAADIIYMLGWELEKTQKPKQTQLFVELDEDEKAVFRFLKEKEKELLDIIALECNIPAYKAASVLMNMEIKGVVRPLPGKLFQLV